MRVVYIITRSDSVGGAHVHVRDLALSLMDRGHEVKILVGGTGPFTEDLRAKDIPYHNLSHLVRPIRPLSDLAAFFEIRQVLAELNPDLVSTHSSKAGWLGRLAARSCGIPVIFTAHGWSFTEGVPKKERMLYRWAERVAAPFADKIITVSEYDRQLAIKYRIAYPSKLVSIHNGMPDVEDRLWAHPENHPVRLAMVARFEPPKDHSTLLRALAKLSDLSWDIDFIGDGPLLEHVIAEADRLTLSKERIFFLGARNDVAERLSRASIFVLTSHWEGFPISILEAMRAGLPVVASDVGGVREAVVDGETGYLVPRGDVNTLRDRLRRLIVDPNLRLRMGQAGRRRYEQYFTLGRMLNRTWEVYEAVLEQRGR